MNWRLKGTMLCLKKQVIKLSEENIEELLVRIEVKLNILQQEINEILATQKKLFGEQLKKVGE